ncbi:MAG: hypothetical protein NTX53_18955 [candidate division WOR-3 bacterium]|nr:hypothetical protein [candidate division WOR-3 bacterium]
MVEVVGRMLDLHGQLRRARVLNVGSYIKRAIIATNKQTGQVPESFGLAEESIETSEVPA